MLKAVTRAARAVDSRLADLNSTRPSNQNALTVANFFDHHATDADMEVAVIEEDFVNARKELVPSVSVEELGHYERVRDAFEGATKKKDADGESGQPARNQGKGQSQSRPPSRVSENDGARPKLSEVMKRANGNVSYIGANSREKVPLANGSAKRHADGAQDSDADEDDLVVRTDQLSVRGGGSRPVSSRGGKGKGKSRDVEVGGEGEDLYD